jgi:16S rRNA (cytidine1402-2'-O)-methyltransferase
MVIVIAPPGGEAEALNEDEIDAMLRRALDRVSVKDAVSEVANATGRPRREIYKRALELSGEPDDGAAS